MRVGLVEKHDCGLKTGMLDSSYTKWRGRLLYVALWQIGLSVGLYSMSAWIRVLQSHTSAVEPYESRSKFNNTIILSTEVRMKIWSYLNGNSGLLRTMPVDTNLMALKIAVHIRQILRSDFGGRRRTVDFIIHHW